MNDSKEEGEDKGKAPSALLKSLEDMLHDRIAKKKIETRKHNNEIAETEKIWTEIETLQWVLSESRSIRRRLEGQEEQQRYNSREKEISGFVYL